MEEAQVLIVSLITGQELIGKVTDMGDSFLIERPAAVVMRPKEENQPPSLALASWPILADPEDIKKNGVHVYKSAVVTPPFKPIMDLLNPYNQAMSGIVIPPRPSLLVG